MMNLWSVNFAFDCINLAAFIAIVVYILKHFVIKYIQQALLAQKHYQELLQQQQQMLRVDCESVVQAAQQQEQRYQDLQAQFASWQERVAALQQQEQQQRAQQRQKIQKLHKQQQQFMQHRRMLEQELPELLQQSQQQLKMKFKNDENLGKAYLSKILQALD